MNDKLIEELREKVERLLAFGKNLNNTTLIELAFEMEEILSRHDKPQESIEPLAVLAGRKGKHIRGVSNETDFWWITIGNNRQNLGKDNGWQDFEAYTYASAELKARQYLESLEDKK
jgi:hypothetical protein